jgi:outer membrane protein assembly factor BamB
MRLHRAIALVAVAMVVAACSASPTSSSSPMTSAPPSSATAASSSAVPAPTTSSATVDWPTYHGDLRRSGVSHDMPAVSHLSLLRFVNLDQSVFASPIVVGGTVVVATEHDVVLGFDRQGRQLWRTELGSPASRSELECGNIDPLGITGTPVFDPVTQLVYLVAEHGSPVSHELVALRPTDGAIAWRTSVDLPGVETRAMQQRGALTVTGGSVYVPFGGLAGDCGGYKGRVVAVPTTGAHAPSAFTVPTAREGGIWTPPGPSVATNGHLFVSVGNGASGPGDPYDHSDAVLELDGTTLVDSFSPTTWAQDNAVDADLGSQGPALVGDRWVFIAGKSGTAYVLDQRDLGGIGGQVSQAQVCASFGGTAVDGSVVYVPCTDGVRAVSISSSGTMRVLWHAASNVAGSPVLGGGRVWSLDQGAGRLYALDASSGTEVASLSVSATSRFATPAITGSTVIVPTLSGVAFVTAS